MRRRPTAIALHGGPGADHSTLKPGLSPLAAECQLIYLDLRGHGRSDAGPPDQWTIARRQRSPQEMEEFRRRIVQRPYAIHERLNAEMKTMDLREELVRIVCPTLLLVGEEDPETPPEAAEQISDGIGPDIARVVRIRNAAHTVLLDQPAAAHEAMRKFLEELEPEPQEHGPSRG